MFSVSRNFLILLVIAVLTAGASLLIPGPAQAFDADDDDGYWKTYWRWYDNDYRPHYHNHYRHHRDYDRNYGYRYRGYDSPYTYGYSPYTYGRYGDFDDRYRYDRYYDRGRRNSVDIGGFRLEWR